jgi:hypothetical protein
VAKERIGVPPKKAARLLAANRHTCCICRDRGKHVDIHHRDGNPANNGWDNLVVVCRDCHSRVTGDEGLGRRYSEHEVLIYKQEWEAQCTPRRDGDEREERIVTAIEPDEHLEYAYSLHEGDVISVAINSTRLVDAFICPTTSYRRWASNGHDVRSCLDTAQSIYEAALEGIADRDGDFSLVVVNNDHETRVKVNVSIAISCDEEYSPT